MAECSTCNAWFDAGKQQGVSGLCRRYPPVPTFGSYAGQPGSGTPKLESYFPTTKGTDWCREYESSAPPGSPA